MADAARRLIGEDLVIQVAYHLASRDLLLYDAAGLDYVVDLYRERARFLLASSPSEGGERVVKQMQAEELRQAQYDAWEHGYDWGAGDGPRNLNRYRKGASRA